MSDLEMENSDDKNYNSKLFKKKCKFCKCDNFMRVNCESKNKQAKLFTEDKVFAKLEDKVNLEE